MEGSRLTGHWRKLASDPCDERYPEGLELRGATYLGTKGAGQGFIVWDAGTYEVAGPNEIKLTIATDELVTYRFSLADDTLTFVDDSGCEIRYRRAD